MDLNYNMFTESALHYRIAFDDDGGDARGRPPYTPGADSIRGLYVRRRHLDLDSEMPEEIATLLFEAMDRTYQTVAQAGNHGVSRTSPVGSYSCADVAKYLAKLGLVAQDPIHRPPKGLV